MTMTNIGLLDYDAVCLKHYVAPNYDLGVTYTYYKDKHDVSVHLITTLTDKNLKQYDIIYIFKDRKDVPSPTTMINNYYSYPIEEYGPGFKTRPLRPFFTETRFTKPDFKCYNSIIRYSLEHPKSILAWKISPRAEKSTYKPVRLFEYFEGEDLKKDYPDSKRLLIFDNPTDLLNNDYKREYLEKLAKKNHILHFKQAVDIASLKNTILLEQVLLNPKYAALRNKMVATSLKNVEYISKLIEKGTLKHKVKIRVDIGGIKSSHEAILVMLDMLTLSRKVDYKMRLYPAGGKVNLIGNELALTLYDFLSIKPGLMSFYEYFFNITYLTQGVPKEILHTGEDKYEYIFKTFGMNAPLRFLESWIANHPEYEEAIFLGGDSNYEKQRRKYYDIGRSSWAFGRSPNDPS